MRCALVFNRLWDFLFGVQIDPASLCRWCKAPIGVVRHAPVPVCRPCFSRAYESQTPGGLWIKLMDDFPSEVERWMRSSRKRQTNE